ncbi:hypothetical protein ACJX0J_038759, partial [Zea mays]
FNALLGISWSNMNKMMDVWLLTWSHFAMSLVVDVRIRLNDLRSEGWDPLFEEVKAFCVEAGIDIPDMDGPIPRFGQLRRGGRNNITQDHFYR